MSEDKTHYRKAFNSPYLSAADIVEPTILTIARVQLLGDLTKKTKDSFNTAFWVEKELRQGEELKPMILNATNSRTLKKLTGSPFIEDWEGVAVTVYTDNNVRFGRDTVEGLRISTEKPKPTRQELTPDNRVAWDKAVARYKKDGNLEMVLKHMDLSDENREKIKQEAAA